MSLYKNRRAVCSLALAIVMSSSNLALATTKLKEAEEKKGKIEEQLDGVQSQLKESKGEANVVAQDIAKLDRQITQASNEVVKVNIEIDKLNIEITKTKEELQQAHTKLKEKQDIFAKRLRVMYKNGSIGYLEILLNSEDVETLLTNSEMISAIAQQDKELIGYIKEQVDIVREKTLQLENQMSRLESKKNDVLIKKANLESANAEKNRYMANLQQNISEFEAEYDNLQKTSNEIEKEINRIKRDIEEQKRIAKQRAAMSRNAASRSLDGINFNVNASPRKGASMIWPVPGHSRITSYFGYRLHPILGYQKLHSGLDIPAPAGTPVVAAADGVVIVATSMGGYGNVVMVDHGETVTIYAHNSVLRARVGDVVMAGEVVSLVGSTGLSTGPHLHFEVRIGGKTVDPLGFV